MKNNKRIVTGIDIGTTKIAVIIAEIQENKSVNIIGFGYSESNGLRRGIVEDIDKTSQSIEKALKEAENQAEIEIESAYVGITGEHVKGINCTGAITISNNEYRDPAGEKISSKDIQKVLEHAQAINLSTDRKILHTLSKEFKVDNRRNIKNPEGLSGHRLEATVHLVTIARNIERDLKTCLEKVGIHFDGFILEPLASAYSVLDANEKNLGIALIDIGGGTSDIIVYYNNSILHTGAIPLGGENITRDVAYGIKTTLEQAEIIKCEYGLAKESLATEENDIIIQGTNGRNDLNVSQKEISQIIEARMKEIFHLAKNEINTADFEGMLNFGIVITGGGSKLNNTIDLAQEIFKVEVKLGEPHSINGLNDIINNPRYATTIGLIKYVSENDNIEIDKEEEEMDLISTIKNNFKKFINYLNIK